MIRAWSEIAELLHRAGLAKLVIVTSHGGNLQAVELIARELRARLGMLVVVCGLAPVRLSRRPVTAPRSATTASMAAAIETSLMLAARPDTVRMEQRAERGADQRRHGARVQVAAHLSPRRVRLDDPGPASLRRGGRCDRGERRERGEAAFAFGARAFVELLAEVDRFDLAGWRRGRWGSLLVCAAPAPHRERIRASVNERGLSALSPDRLRDHGPLPAGAKWTTAPHAYCSNRSMYHLSRRIQTSSLPTASSMPCSRLGLSLTSMTTMPSSVCLRSTP